jgi:hypothetical protein
MIRRCMWEPLLWFTVAEGQGGCRAVGVTVCACVTIETDYLFTKQSIIVSLYKEGIQIRPGLYASLLVFDQYSTPPFPPYWSPHTPSKHPPPCGYVLLLSTQ